VLDRTLQACVGCHARSARDLEEDGLKVTHYCGSVAMMSGPRARSATQSSHSHRGQPPPPPAKRPPASPAETWQWIDRMEQRCTYDESHDEARTPADFAVAREDEAAENAADSRDPSVQEKEEGRGEADQHPTRERRQRCEGVAHDGTPAAANARYVANPPVRLRTR
jgi:hypothetical protein